MTDSQLIQTALASLLVGGGTYGAMRGMRDIGGPPAPEPNANELEVTLPSSKVPKPMLQHNKVAETVEDTSNMSPGQLLLQGGLKYGLPALAVGGGLYGGFQGASKLYDHFEGKKIEDSQEQAKQQYLQALQRASVKVGSLNTPNVDKFLTGFIEKVGEQGVLGNIARAIGGEAQAAGKKLLDLFGDGVHNSSKWMANQDLTGLTMAGVGLGTLGVAGGTSYLAHRMDQNKEDAKRKTQLPTEIRLNVQ